MSSLTSTEAVTIRSYVEDEVERFVLPRWPSVTFSRVSDDEKPRQAPTLRWKLTTSVGDPSGLLIGRHYLIEADAGRTEIIIWFGAIGGFDLRLGTKSTRDVMRPAVHVPFPELLEARLRGEVGPSRVPFPFLDRVLKSAEIFRGITTAPEEGGLAAALLHMLDYEHEPQGDDWDLVVYPFNGTRY